MSVAFIGVGANLEPEKNIRTALVLLQKEARVTGSSTFYRTRPIGARDQPAYINGVWQIDTELSAGDIKPRLLSPLERRLGRRRTRDKCSPRTIDLDLILYDDLVIDDGELQLPHPDLRRPFVYFPVVELLDQMSPECFGDLPRRIQQLLPAVPAAQPGAPLQEFTRELRKLLD